MKILHQFDEVFDTQAVFRKLSAILVQAKCGTLVDPHKSATLLIRDNAEKAETCTLYGPGIDGETELCCSETVCQALRLREQQAYEYPMGVDLIFVTDSGNITCIPRLVKRRDAAWHILCCVVSDRFIP